MPRNTSLTIGASWTQLTDADITEITFQNVGSQPILVAGTNGPTEPAGEAGLIYAPSQGEATRLLADLFPGVTGVNRVWARAQGAQTQVFVSHA